MMFLIQVLSLHLLLTSSFSVAMTDDERLKLMQGFPEIKPMENDFGVGGKGGNFRPDLWLRGAALIIPQLNKIIDFVSPGFEMESMTVEEGHAYFKSHENKKKVKLLDHILGGYHSDKSVFYQHYHHVYAYIFDELLKSKTSLRTLEIGLGTNNTALVSTMGGSGRPGASLRAFSKYLPTSDIFGADVDKDILFNEGRIRTTYVDGYNYSTYEELYKEFGSQPFDFIIDDAAHAMATDLNTVIFALNHINVPGWIVVEDIVPLMQFPSFRVLDYLLKTRVSDDVVIKSSMVYTAHRRNGKGKTDPQTKSMIYVISVKKKE